MRSYSFTDLLQEATSVENLAQRLGAACLEQEAELRVELDDVLLSEMVDDLRDQVIATEPDDWLPVVSDPEKIRRRLGPGLAAALEEAEPHYPLDCLGVLRGLCRRVLPRLYARQRSTVPLDRGAPVPFAPRPLLSGVEKTPRQETGNQGSLLGGYGHRFFEFWRERETVRVALDFRVRQQVDELTWTGGERLPRIATVHPQDCGRVRVESISDGSFFGVRPEHWRPEEVVDLLARVGDVEIAVLPELSLPEPGALEEALAAGAGEFPRLIVAGSAHVEAQNGTKPLRANEARIYVDGKHVGSHRKCNAYYATKLNGQEVSPPLREAITGEPKEITVLSGEFTRLAVVICNDLNDTDGIPQKLLAAGVSTLLVPSFTPKKGSFRGPAGDLAARCQAVVAIANAPPAESASPFHGMIAVPLPDPTEAVDVYPKPDRPAAGRIAVFDPNKPLKEAVKWR
jgi:predicted amidohydrolase